MVGMNALIAANAKRFASAKLTGNIVSIANSLVRAKRRYQAVETATDVPWWGHRIHL